MSENISKQDIETYIYNNTTKNIFLANKQISKSCMGKNQKWNYILYHFQIIYNDKLFDKPNLNRRTCFLLTLYKRFSLAFSRFFVKLHFQDHKYLTMSTFSKFDIIALFIMIDKRLLKPISLLFLENSFADQKPSKSSIHDE